MMKGKLTKLDEWVYNNNIKYHLYTKIPLLVLGVLYVVFFMGVNDDS